MAWPSEAGAIASPVSSIILPAAPVVVQPVVIQPPAFRGIHYFGFRGSYVIFNAAGYYFWYGDTIPDPDSPYQDTNATLPHTPVDTFTDGIKYFSLKYSNGVIISDFLPVGANGATYLRLDLDTGAELAGPPNRQGDVRLELKAGGVVRVVAFYGQTAGVARAEEFAIYATFDGSDPGSGPDDIADYTVAIGTSGLAILTYDLPAQADDTEVKVRVQMSRDDSGTDRFSDTSADDILTTNADAAGPVVLQETINWTGVLPEDL